MIRGRVEAPWGHYVVISGHECGTLGVRWLRCVIEEKLC